MPRLERTNCQYCGGLYDHTDGWPRRCTDCGEVAFWSPEPVVNALIPVPGGLVGIRRNIEPYKGTLAFPGGYVDHGEPWQEAATREMREELGLDLGETGWKILEARTTRTNYFCLFVAPTNPGSLRLEDIPAVRDPAGVSNGEISEVVLLPFFGGAGADRIPLGVPSHNTFYKTLSPSRFP